MSQNKQNQAKVQNDEALEKSWAESAFKYAELFQKMVIKTDDAKMTTFRFTPHDDKLYEKFRKTFPKLSVEIIDIDELKSGKNKLEWYNFCEQNKHMVKDYNMGTLMRINSQKPFGQDNSTITPRIQFYCIELARFREGFNLTFKHSFSDKIDADAPQEPDEYTYKFADSIKDNIDKNGQIDKSK